MPRWTSHRAPGTRSVVHTTNDPERFQVFWARNYYTVALWFTSKYTFASLFNRLTLLDSERYRCEACPQRKVLMSCDVYLRYRFWVLLQHCCIMHVPSAPCAIQQVVKNELLTGGRRPRRTTSSIALSRDVSAPADGSRSRGVINRSSSGMVAETVKRPNRAKPKPQQKRPATATASKAGKSQHMLGCARADVSVGSVDFLLIPIVLLFVCTELLEQYSIVFRFHTLAEFL